MSGDDSQPDPSSPGVDPDEVKEESRYERLGLLGQGGMGRVYMVRDARLRRQVALKVAATPALAGRLAREAWITAQLEHPGIVAVYDAGNQDGQTWYTMRLIRGKTLSERISTCADLGERLALLPHFLAACQAVAYAHAKGILHRDLKPANIMVGEFGETQVADWGLARPTEEARADWQAILRGGEEEHSGGGTPRYMSPEAVSGATVGAPSDVYALGASLRDLLEGDTQGKSTTSVIPPELAAIARRCLREDPALRYPSAVELAADLERWLSGRRVLAHDYQPLELLGRLVAAWRGPLVVAGLALVLLGIGAVVAAQNTARERALAEANLALALTQQGLTALGDGRLPEANILAAHALLYGPSPSARGLLAGTGPANATLVQRRPLPSPCQYSSVLSPDGRSLACHGEGKVEVWGVDPLERRSSVELQTVEAPVWVGERLLVATPEEMLWVEGERVLPTGEPSGWPLSLGGTAFVLIGPRGRILRPDAEGQSFETCFATRATTLANAEGLLVGCHDGQLRRYDPQGNSVFSLDLGERPAWSALQWRGAELLVGRLDGAVQRLKLPEASWSQPLPGKSGSILSMQPVPGTSLVAVLGESGGPRLWSTEAEAWVGSLPGGASRMGPGQQPGELLLIGATLDRWKVVTQPRPAVLNFEVGISQVTVSPSGEDVAIALGNGVVVERRVADGLELRRWAWTNNVVKCVAYGPGGTLVASAIGGRVQQLGPGEEVAELGVGTALRRCGSLDGGRLWMLGYTDLVILREAAGRLRQQMLGPGPVDGSSSPGGGTAVLLDSQGTIYVLEGDSWKERPAVAEAIAVDVGEGGLPLVVARRRELCINSRCVEVDGEIVDIAFSPPYVAVATVAGEIWLLDGETGETRALLRGHRGRVSSVEFGPQARWLVSGSWDQSLRIWDLADLDRPASELVVRGRENWGLELEDVLGGH